MILNRETVDMCVKSHRKDLLTIMNNKCERFLYRLNKEFNSDLLSALETPQSFMWEQFVAVAPFINVDMIPNLTSDINRLININAKYGYETRKTNTKVIIKTIADVFSNRGIKSMKNNDPIAFECFYLSLLPKERAQFMYEVRKLIPENYFYKLEKIYKNSVFVGDLMKIFPIHGDLRSVWSECPSLLLCEYDYDFVSHIQHYYKKLKSKSTINVLDNVSTTCKHERTEEEKHEHMIRVLRAQKLKKDPNVSWKAVDIREDEISVPWYEITKKSNRYKITRVQHNNALCRGTDFRIFNKEGGEFIVVKNKTVNRIKFQNKPKTKKEISTENKNFSGKIYNRLLNAIADKIRKNSEVSNRQLYRHLATTLEWSSDFSRNYEFSSQLKMFEPNLQKFITTTDDGDIEEWYDAVQEQNEVLEYEGLSSYISETQIYKFIREYVNKIAKKVYDKTFDNSYILKIKSYVKTIVEAIKCAVRRIKHAICDKIMDFIQKISDNIIIETLSKGYNLIPDQIISVFALLLVFMPWMITGIPLVFKIAIMALGVLCQFVNKASALAIFLTTTSATYFLRNKEGELLEHQGYKEDFASIGTNLLGLGALLYCGMHGLSIPKDADSIDKFLSRNAKLASATRVFKLGFDQLCELFQASMKVVYRFFYGIEHIDPDLVPEIDEMDKEMQVLMSLDKNYLIGKDPEINNRVQALYYRFHEVRRRYAKVPVAQKHLNEIATPIFTMYNRLLDKNPKSSNIRPEPVSVMFTGSSGVGKTSLIMRVAQDCLKLANLWNKETKFEGMIYKRAVDQVFWDGYSGQPICVFDDFGQKVDSITSPNLEFFEIIHAVNSFYFPTHCASIAEKANNPFTSKFILLTSNLEHDIEPKSIICKDALDRRIHARFSLGVIPQIQNSKKGIDPVKLIKYREDNNLPPYDMSHYVFIDKKRNNRQITYDEVVNEIKNVYIMNQKIYESNMQAAELLSDTPLSIKTNEIKDELTFDYLNFEGPDDDDFLDAFEPDPFVDYVKKNSIKTQYEVDLAKVEEDVKLGLYGTKHDKSKCKTCLYAPYIDTHHTRPPHNFIPIEEIPEDIKSILKKVKINTEGQDFLNYGCTPTNMRQKLKESFDKEGVPGSTKFFGNRNNIIDHRIFRTLPSSTQQRMLDNNIVPLNPSENIYITPYLDLTALDDKEIIKYSNYLHQNTEFFTYPWNIEDYVEQLPPQQKEKCVGILTKFKSRIVDSVYALYSKALEYVKIIGCILGAAAAIVGVYKTWKYLNNNSYYSIDCYKHLYDDPEQLCLCKEKETFIRLGETIPYTSDCHECCKKMSKGELCSHRMTLFEAKHKSFLDKVEKKTEEFSKEASISGSDGLEGIRKKRKKFNMESPVYKLKNILELEAPKSTQASELADKMFKNIKAVYRVCRGKEALLGTVLFIKGNVGLMNKHFIENMVEHLSREEAEDAYLEFRTYGMSTGVRMPLRDFAYSIRELTIGDFEREIILFKGPKDLPPQTDISKHFIRNKDIGKLEDVTGYRVLMSTVSKGSHKHTVRDGSILSFQDISIDEGETLKTYAKCIKYEISSEKGDCGSPIIINSDQFPNKIIGIHFGGKEGIGAANIITYEIIERYIRNQISGSEDKFVKQSVDISEVPLNGAFGIMGKLQELIPTPLKTKIRPSEIFEQVIPTTMAPAKLCPPLLEDGPMVKGIMKYKDPNISLDEEIIEKCISDYAYTLVDNSNQKPYGFERRVLTFEEACRGIPGTEYMSPLKRTTSAGYPYMLTATKGKTDWFGSEEWDFTSEKTKELKEDVYTALDKCRSGEIPDFYFVSTLKDEKRSIEKVQQGKTRVFAAAPLHYSILMRMYFLGFISYLTRNRISNGVAVGTNPYSIDWKNMYDYLNKFGPKSLIAGDFSSFDGSINFHLFNKIVDLVNIFYNDSPQNQKVRRILWRATSQSKQILGNIVFQICKGQPSGTPLTAISNSIYVNLAIRYCYYLIMDRLTDFRKNVYCIAYGDDNIIAVRRDIQNEFTPTALTTAFKEIGMSYTSEDKSEQTDVFRSANEVTFLKRGFFEENGFVFAPLSLTSILEMTNWITSSIPSEQATIDNCHSSISELYFHPREVFEEWAPKIRDVCRKNNLFVNYVSYDVGRRAIREGDFSLLGGDKMPTAFMHQRNNLLTSVENTTQVNMDQNLRYCNLQIPTEMHLVLTTQAKFDTKLKQFLKKFLHTHKISELTNKDIGFLRDGNSKYKVVPKIEGINYTSNEDIIDQGCKATYRQGKIYWYICQSCWKEFTMPYLNQYNDSLEYQSLDKSEYSSTNGDENDALLGDGDTQQQLDTVGIEVDGSVPIVKTINSTLYKLKSFLKPGTENKHPIEAYLNRPYKVSGKTFEPNKFYTISVQDIVKNHMPFYDKMKNFYAFRGNIRIKVFISCDPLTQGLLGVGFVPHEDYITWPDNSRAAGLQFFSQLQHVKANINTDSMVELSVPYVGLTDYWNFNSSSKSDKQFGCFVITWLIPPTCGNNSPQVDTNIYMNFEDIDMFGQTYENSDVSHEPLEYQSGFVSGMIESAVAGIGTNIVTDAIKNTFNSFKEAALPNFMRTTNQSIGNMVCSGGQDTAITMAASEKNRIENMALGVNDDSSMSIAKEAQKFSFCDSFEWRADSGLKQEISLTPDYCTNETFKESNMVYRMGKDQQYHDHMTIRNETRLSYIAGMFKYYRGSILLKFTVVATKFHSGKLKFIFSPNKPYGRLNDIALEDEKVYTQIVDIRESREFIIKVPYIGVSAWKTIVSSEDANYFRIEEEQPLYCPDNVAKKVDIYMEIAAGEDIQFAVPAVVSNRPFTHHKIHKKVDEYPREAINYRAQVQHVLKYQGITEDDIKEYSKNTKGMKSEKTLKNELKVLIKNTKQKDKKEYFKKQSGDGKVCQVFDITNGNIDQEYYKNLSSSLSVGEIIHDFRQLLCRYSWVANVKDAIYHSWYFRTYHASAFNPPSGVSAVSLPWDFFQKDQVRQLYINPSYFCRIAHMFLFARGSMRFLFGGDNVVLSARNIKDSYTNEHQNDFTYRYKRASDTLDPEGAKVWQADFTSQMPHNTVQMINGSTTRSIQLPFYNKLSKLYNNFTFVSQQLDVAENAKATDHTLLDVYSSDSSEAPLYVACGSDYQMGYGIPCPRTIECETLIQFQQK